MAATGVFNGDGGGTFSFGINCPACGGGASDAFDTDIVFHVANATITDLTQLNDKNQVFVADVIAPNQNTGLIDATTPRPSVVPEPASLLLLGAGLAGIGLCSGSDARPGKRNFLLSSRSQLNEGPVSHKGLALRIFPPESSG